MLHVNRVHFRDDERVIGRAARFGDAARERGQGIVDNGWIAGEGIGADGEGVGVHCGEAALGMGQDADTEGSTRGEEGAYGRVGAECEQDEGRLGGERHEGGNRCRDESRIVAAGGDRDAARPVGERLTEAGRLQGHAG